MLPGHAVTKSHDLPQSSWQSFKGTFAQKMLESSPVMQRGIFLQENSTAGYLYFKTLFIRFKAFDFYHLVSLIAQQI